MLQHMSHSWDTPEKIFVFRQKIHRSVVVSVLHRVSHSCDKLSMASNALAVYLLRSLKNFPKMATRPRRAHDDEISVKETD